MVNDLLKEIFNSGVVADKSGNIYRLHSGISRDEGAFIWQLIKENNVEQSVEVGCAYGISSLYICDALSQRPSPRHVIIDPYQSVDWHDVGTHNLDRAGFSFYELLEKPSELAFPTLLERGRCFDFAFIDGWHTFDHALLDFFYVDRLLHVGGIIVFDDVQLRPVRKALRYIVNYPNYKVIGSVQGKQSGQRKLANKVKRGLHRVIRFIPDRVAEEIFDDSVVRPDTLLGLEATMVALRKTGPDERGFKWYAPF